MEPTKKASNLYQKELRRSLIGFGVVPVLFITLIFYNVFFVVSYHILKKNNENESKQVANELVDKFSLIAKQSQMLSKKINIGKLESSNSYRTEVYEQLYNAVNEQKLNSLFTIINIKGDVLATNWLETPTNNRKNTVWYLNKRLKSSDGKESLMYPNRQSLENDRVFYNIANAIYDSNGEVSGYILFNLLENKFRQLINNVHYTDIIITNQYSHSILTSNEMLLTQGGKLQAISNKEYIMNKTALFDGNIEVHSILYIGLFKSIYEGGLFTLLTVFILITIGTIGFANYTARKKMTSIERLLKVINKAKKGHFNQEVKMPREDEFQVIGDYLQQLLTDIESLILKNKESVERNAQAEIKQLEMQINPHFLFNTLENIKYMIKIDSIKAEKLIVILSNLLRYSINNKTQFNSIENDNNYLKDYLMLQQIRFGDALSYSIDVEEKTRNYQIPKLIIQPLVENAIKYSFKTKASLKIEVLIKSTKRDVYLIIRDNGEGIEQEQLKNLQASLRNEINDTSHIGIYNVHRRIQLLFGNKRYGLRIFSTEGIGTLVVVRIPIVRGE
ncbi:MAG: sensor histidine kinase [Bacillaceae bacterium]